MSILIKGMEIPEDNAVLLRIYPESEGVFYVEQLDVDDDILDKYWAVPVPEHGRLIDADAAIADIRGEILEHQMNGMKGTPFYIEDLRTMWQRLEDEEMCHTVIPADPAEEDE